VKKKKSKKSKRANVPKRKPSRSGGVAQIIKLRKLGHIHVAFKRGKKTFAAMEVPEDLVTLEEAIANLEETRANLAEASDFADKFGNSPINVDTVEELTAEEHREFIMFMLLASDLNSQIPLEVGDEFWINGEFHAEIGFTELLVIQSEEEPDYNAQEEAFILDFLRNSSGDLAVLTMGLLRFSREMREKIMSYIEHEDGIDLNDFEAWKKKILEAREIGEKFPGDITVSFVRDDQTVGFTYIPPDDVSPEDYDYIFDNDDSEFLKPFYEHLKPIEGQRDYYIAMLAAAELYPDTALEVGDAIWFDETFYGKLGYVMLSKIRYMTLDIDDAEHETEYRKAVIHDFLFDIKDLNKSEQTSAMLTLPKEARTEAVGYIIWSGEGEESLEDFENWKQMILSAP
jgi:hypothetical protein